MRIAAAFWLGALVVTLSAPALAQEDEEATDQPWEQEKKKDPKPAKGADPAAPEAEGTDGEKPDAKTAPPPGEKTAPKPAKQEKAKKGKGAKEGAAPAPPQGFKGAVIEETHDYIRCKDDVYQKFLQAREEYTALKRQQTNLLSLINREQKTLEKIQELSDDEIEADVKATQVKALSKTIEEAQDKLKKLEPKLMEKLYKYEPLRSKCED
jgi:hypothetical protein